MRSPHIWHVPCPQRKIILRNRSMQTGHIVYRGASRWVGTGTRKQQMWRKPVMKFLRQSFFYLFFDILELLLELLDVCVAVVATSVIHHGPLLGWNSGRPGDFGIDRATTAGRESGWVIQTTANHVRDDAIDLRATLDAFLHEGSAPIASAHVTARTEQHRRFFVWADNALFDLDHSSLTLVRNARWKNNK